MQSTLKTFAGPKAISCFISFVLFLLSSHTQAQLQDHSSVNLQKVLDEVLKNRGQYVETFKDLTAQETKLTELFDEQGRLKAQRTVVSDFLVYLSQVNDGVVSEYRVVREVDGKPISNSSEEAQRLIEKLAKTKTLTAEHKRLVEQNMKYNLHYYRWDVTLNPARQFAEAAKSDYTYEILGNEKLGSREVVILGYQKKSFDPVKARGIFSDFSNPEVSDRGRLWVDARTFKICQWENELVVRHLETGNTLVVMRDQVEYVDSNFGILVPKTITITFFDRLSYKRGNVAPPRTLLSGRITYRYDSFKRFNVTGDYELSKPPNR